VEKGRLLEDEARHFFQQIVSGVEYCHRNMVSTPLALEIAAMNGLLCGGQMNVSYCQAMQVSMRACTLAQQSAKAMAILLTCAGGTQRPEAGEPAPGYQQQCENRRLWTQQCHARWPLPEDQLRVAQLRCT
jgi:hypothetical protein